MIHVDVRLSLDMLQHTIKVMKKASASDVRNNSKFIIVLNLEEKCHMNVHTKLHFLLVGRIFPSHWFRNFVQSLSGTLPPSLSFTTGNTIGARDIVERKRAALFAEREKISPCF